MWNISGTEELPLKVKPRKYTNERRSLQLNPGLLRMILPMVQGMPFMLVRCNLICRCKLILGQRTVEYNSNLSVLDMLRSICLYITQGFILAVMFGPKGFPVSGNIILNIIRKFCRLASLKAVGHSSRKPTSPPTFRRLLKTSSASYRCCHWCIRRE